MGQSHKLRFNPRPDSTTNDRRASGRYRCGAILRFPVGNGFELVYAKQNHAAVIIPSPLAEWLTRCSTFKTIPEHAEDCYHDLNARQEQEELAISALSSSTLPPVIARMLERLRGFARQHSHDDETDRAAVATIAAQLSALIEPGLLVGQSHLMQRRSQHADIQPDTGSITAIGVVTRNRAASLERCLTSFIENSKRHGRTPSFVVADDSAKPEAQNANREMLRALKARFDIEIFYAGRDEKLRFARALIAPGDLPPDAVEFALFDTARCGRSTGANRNALLLHNAGEMFFTADDDTLCRIATEPEASAGVAFESGAEFLQWRFYPDRESAQRAAEFVDEDILATHEQMLGKRLADCDFGGRAPLRLERMGDEFIKSLQSGSGSVRLTLNGIIGDSGMGSPLLFSLRGDSRARLVQSASSYRAAHASREIWRTVQQTTITSDPWCMAGAMGYDNRELLPPFFPVQRNQDGLFGITLRACFKDTFLAHLPRAILHAPGETGLPPNASRQAAASVQMWKVILACITSFAFAPGQADGKKRLRALGNHLLELGGLPLPDFEEFIRVRIWGMQSAGIAVLENQLQTFQATPAFWANDIKSYLDVLQNAMAKRSYIIPQDLLNRHSADAARLLSQRLTQQFGKLLHCWPDMVETAKALRAGGQRLAVAL